MTEGIQGREITLADQEKVNRLYHTYGHGDSAHAFPSLFLWKKDMGLSILMREEAYTVRCAWKGKNRWFFPCGSKAGKKACIEELMRGGCRGLIYMDEEDAGFLEEHFPGAFHIHEAPEDSEVWLIAEKPRVSCPDEVITARTGGSTTMARLIGRDNNLYFDRPVLALCLGGAESVSGSCTLTFRDASGIVWDAFRAVALPMAEFRGNVERRREEALEDVSWENDRVTGNITVSGDRILQLSLPYSRGWSARVDGRRAELFPCGGMYCGVALTEGTHEIELRYVTPGLRAGVALSALGLLGMLLLGILRRRYRKVREGIADQGA